MKKVTTPVSVPKTPRTTSARTNKASTSAPVQGAQTTDDRDDDVDAFESTASKRDRPQTPQANAQNGSKSGPLQARIAKELPGAAIPGADRELLGAYRFDEAAHKKLMAGVKNGTLTPEASLFRGKIAPPRDGDVQRLPVAGSVDDKRLRDRGERALKAGEVAVVVLAGGMATRFQGAPGIKLEPGEQVVKGTVDVIDGKSFIALKLDDARRAAEKYGADIPFCVMGSFGTLKGRNGLERHLEDTGLMGDDVKLFSQSISLRTTPDGDIFGAKDLKPGEKLPNTSYTTPGHGDFFQAIRDSGVLDELLASGVKTIMFSNVDNLGATVDPRIIGKFLDERDRKGTAIMAETVERMPEDGAKTGTAIRAGDDGLFRILEGFRIPDDVAKSVALPEVSINTFYFDAAKLKQDIALDVHAVKKKVDGKDAIQFETVTCEATGTLDANGKPLLPLSVLRLPREGAVGRFQDGRFYPVKTPEDLDKVRSLLRESPVYGAAETSSSSSSSSADRSKRLAKLDREFATKFADTQKASEGPKRSFSSPGRINIIGEHVDYQDGIALPAAVHLGVLMTSQARSDGEVVLHSLDLEEPVRFSLKNPRIDGDTTWGKYAKAVTLAFAEKNIQLKGMQAVLESSLPPGSGMSSSSALCLALAKAFARHANAAGVQMSNKELVLLAQRAEHIVGVNCGNMDQSAIVNGKKDNAVLLDCRTLETKNVPLHLGDYVLVVGNTKKARGLVDSEYNARRAECEAAVVELKKLTGRSSITTLRDVTIEDLDKHGAKLAPKLRQRARHVVEEIARVQRFVAELEKGGADVQQRLGKLLDESHASLRDLFEVSCPELDAMVELSRAYGAEQGSVPGSRMMGGGFGGCTLSLVRRDAVEGFKTAVGAAYEKKTGLKPEFYVVEPDDGVAEIARPENIAKVPHMVIRNPISWDECPDPSVLKVGNDFYVANTRPQPQNFKPGEAAYPLRKAVNGDFNNLVDIGNVFPAGKAPTWLHVDPWAPEFHFDKELGYTVTFTGRNKDGKLCIGMAFADKPEGPYVEKTPGPFLVNPEIGVIDSHVTFDESTGKRMFLWKEDWNDRPGAKKTTPLLMQELKVVDGVPKLVGKRTQTIENDLPFEHDLVEGASIIKRGDHHYMFYSAGPYYNGDYVTSVARAKSLDGPWEKIGKNVMPNDENWEGRGHGYVAQVEGNDYFVCHGYPKGDYAKRVMLMFPIHWDESGWPRVDTNMPMRT